MDFHDTIVQGEASQKLAELPEACAQTIVTSPPYWKMRRYPDSGAVWGGSADCDHSFTIYSIYQDSPIRGEGGAGFKSDDTAEQLKSDRWYDCGVCDHCGAFRGELGLEPTVELYLDHLMDIFTEVYRVLDDEGSFWLNIGDKYVNKRNGAGGDVDEFIDAVHAPKYTPNTSITLPSKTRAMIPKRLGLKMVSYGFRLRDTVVWEKSNPTPFPHGNRLNDTWEVIMRFTKTENDRFRDDDLKLSTDVFTSSTATVEGHTAAFPDVVPRTAIKATSEPDGLVVDPFCGVGTTCLAAKELNRRYHGIDISPDYVKLARQRLHSG